MWTTKYILSQIFIVLAVFAVVPSFFVKDKRKVLILGMINTFCYFTHYFLLGSATGALINVANMPRLIWFYVDNKQGKRQNYWSLGICSAMAIGFGVVGFRYWFDFLSILASFILTFAYWQNDSTIYTVIYFISSIIWIVYGICYKSIFGIITELIILLFEIVRLLKIKKDRT